MAAVTLSSKQLRTLVRARNLLDEVVETMEILADAPTRRAIAEAMADVPAGRTRPYAELRKELRLQARAGHLRRRN